MRVLLSLLLASALGGCSLIQQWFAPAAPCSQPVYRQFDFWLGDWDVRRKGESEAKARNRISQIMQGCALKEAYSADSGYSGESLNWYDLETGQWRQSWVDNAGTVLQLAGGLNEQGEMVLTGRSRRDEQGELILDRIRWSPQPDGSVLQHWDSYSEQTQQWSLVFEGLYIRSATQAVVDDVNMDEDAGVDADGAEPAVEPTGNE